MPRFYNPAESSEDTNCEELLNLNISERRYVRGCGYMAHKVRQWPPIRDTVPLVLLEDAMIGPHSISSNR